MNKQIDLLIEFFEMNSIPPHDAVPMAMTFISCSCKGVIEEDKLISMFGRAVKSIYRENQDD